MKSQKVKLIVCLLLSYSVLLNGLILPCYSQEKPIVISFGQPNIWSFEQAHYLLGRMHRQNLDLQTAELLDLDPNEVNSQRINIVKTLLGVGFKYDEAIRINNEFRKKDKTLNSQRKPELIAQRTVLQAESIQLAREISALKVAKTKTKDEGEKETIDAQIEAKTEQKAAVDEQITQINDELKTVTTVSGDFESVDSEEGFNADKLPKSALDALIKDKFKDSNPTIAASQRLENHVQMQYEIIAKQLTLLRDEVGPGERLVFLELPQSINTVQNEANNKQAQVWWRISGYTKIDRSKQFENETAKLKSEIAELSDKINQNKAKRKSFYGESPELKKETAKLEQERTSLLIKYETLEIQSDRKKIKSVRDNTERLLQGGGENTEIVVGKTREMMEKTGDYYALTYKNNKNNEDGRNYISLESPNSTNDTAQIRQRTVRTIDIIPRQNALNVNDVKETVKATGIFAAVSFLFGFGGNIRYQRQRETFEQSLNQELYTSGFGKGGTDFGWNFYPFAGTKQISPGVRTTYAVAVIPEDTEAITLKARGCYFPRTSYQPNEYEATKNWNVGNNSKKWGCSEREEVFILAVPGGGSDSGADFYATEMNYSKNRSPKDRMTVSINGRNFSPQIGVLIDGVALTEAVGLAQSNVESTVSDKVKAICEKDVCGRFERIDASQIILSFVVPNGYRGVPRISLISPGKAIELNKLNLRINGAEDAQLDDLNDMFGKPDYTPPISIEEFQIALPTKAVLIGNGFDKVSGFYVNGKNANCNDETKGKKSVCILDFAETASETFIVTLVPTDETDEVISKTFPNPYSLKINNASIVAFEAADKTTPSVLTVKLEGAGFHNGLNVYLDDTSLKRGTSRRSTIIPTSGQMVLEITSPGPVLQITLTDPITSKSVSTIIRVPSPEQKSEDTENK